MKPIKSGQLRHKISIESVYEIQGSKGEIVKTWSELTTRRCKIQPTAGNEYFQSQKVNAQTSIAITMRSDSVTQTVNTKNRLVFGSRIFDVQSILNNLEKNNELTFMCREHA